MSVADPGEEFWDDLAHTQENLDPDASDAWAHENEEFEDDLDASGHFGITDLQADGSFGLSFHPPTTEQEVEDPPDTAAFDTSEVRISKKIHPLSRNTKRHFCQCF